MRTMKKLAGLLLALIMAMALAAPAMAVEGGSNADYSITITIPDIPEGDTPQYPYTYELIRIFDASYNEDTKSVVYTIAGDSSNIALAQELLKDFVTVSDDGKITHSYEENATLSDTAVAAIKAYVARAAGLTKTPATISKEEGPTKTFTGLAPGYYYITTPTGAVVMIDSNTPNARVKDKNEVPSITKGVEGGDQYIYQAGDVVPFELTVTAKKGAKTYVIHDTMSSNLALIADSIKVTSKNGNNYNNPQLWTLNATPENGHCTFEITFNFGADGLAADDVITVTYNATVKLDNLNTDATKGTNDVYMDYGSGTTPGDHVDVYNATITVMKYAQDGDNEAARTPLEGAGFKLRKGAGTPEDPYLYYKRTVDAAGNVTVEWVTDTEGDKADEFFSKADGTLDHDFTGLEAGTYTLVESTVPDGYNGAEDQTFEVKEIIEGGKLTAESIASLTNEATVINRSGTLLPSTGGIGTTIFYMAGGILMIGAVVLFITKKRISGN